MKRYGQVIRVKPERYEEYREYHRNVWPEIIELGRQCNIRNQTIFHRDGLLFRYFEYTGDDYEADKAAAAAHPWNQAWWELMQPMQEPLESCAEGEWWADMEELVHTE